MIKPVHNLILLFFIPFVGQLMAQDIHLSHIHASPTLLNPAMTALFNGDLRLIGNTKSQWQNVTKGYKTVVGSADGQLYKVGRNDVLGGGIQLYSDKAGDLDFTTRSAAINFSYLKSLDRLGTNFISFGVQNSFVNNSVNFSNIIAFDSEPSIMEGESNSYNYWDISMGIAWFYAIDRDNSFHLGGSIFHVNQPENTFFKPGIRATDTGLFRKYSAHGSGDFRVGKNSYLKPSFLINLQGPHRETTFGTFFKYKSFKNNPNNPGAALYVGSWLRWNMASGIRGVDALIVATRLDLKDFFITFSFDMNISSLAVVTKGHGGPELSVVKILHFKRGNRRPVKVKCPDF